MALGLNINSGVRVVYVSANGENRQAFGYALMNVCGEGGAVTFADHDEALTFLRQDPDFSVVVADEDSVAEGDTAGIAFLRQVLEVAPLATRILLVNQQVDGATTGTESSAERGYHYRYAKVLLGQGQELVDLIQRAADQYARRVVKGLLGQHQPMIRSRLQERGIDVNPLVLRARPIVVLCRMLAGYLDITLVERRLLEVAAAYYNIGSGASTNQTDAMRIAAAVMYDLPGLEAVHQGILDWMEQWDGIGPAAKCGESISLLGRVLAVLHAFNAGMCGVPHDDPLSVAMRINLALNHLQIYAGRTYDPQIVRAFAQMVGERRKEIQKLYELLPA